jgi:hypothetical protein
VRPSWLRRLAFALVALGAWIAPSSTRDQWRRQWRADLWHRCDALERAGLMNAQPVPYGTPAGFGFAEEDPCSCMT